ncbi:WXG100 family type VII secretion target [Actinoallomurus spadix]|uniref:ESAT-6-like protein n=1 Tax=Actinoallomurus spadix TaxID=79912 RepID=A0ABN0XQZ7_9ACTN|nr:WXG100 family type VII secretion target [Actinoallomurus spadix]MCO5991444.1 WXG100 family type VII secretion target [Actinoallomurus spadix]
MADTGGGGQTAGDTEFGIALQALSDAIATVQREHDGISKTLEQIKSKMSDLNLYWKGPAYDSLDPVETWYANATSQMMGLLQEIIDRMQKSYDNYHQAESVNAANVTPA